MTIKIERVAVSLFRELRTHRDAKQIMQSNAQFAEAEAKARRPHLVRRESEKANNGMVGNMLLRHLLTSYHPLTIIRKLKRHDITK